jgi:hypothetical protein
LAGRLGKQATNEPKHATAKEARAYLAGLKLPKKP